MDAVFQTESQWGYAKTQVHKPKPISVSVSQTLIHLKTFLQCNTHKLWSAKILPNQIHQILQLLRSPCTCIQFISCSVLMLCTEFNLKYLLKKDTSTGFASLLTVHFTILTRSPLRIRLVTIVLETPMVTSQTECTSMHKRQTRSYF